MVESRIRTLVQDLEVVETVLLAHPRAGGISADFICLTEEEQAAASQGEMSPEAMQRKEEDFVGQDYKKVYTKNFFVGLEIEKKPSALGEDHTNTSRGSEGSRREDIEPLLPQQALLRCLQPVGQV